MLILKASMDTFYRDYAGPCLILGATNTWHRNLNNLLNDLLKTIRHHRFHFKHGLRQSNRKRARDNAVANIQFTYMWQS